MPVSTVMLRNAQAITSAKPRLNTRVSDSSAVAGRSTTSSGHHELEPARTVPVQGAEVPSSRSEPRRLSTSAPKRKRNGMLGRRPLSSVGCDENTLRLSDPASPRTRAPT